MKSIKYLFILATVGLIFNSCTKQVAGPTGKQGAQGPQGPSSNFYVTIDSVPAASWAPTASEFYYTFNPVNHLTDPNTSSVNVFVSQSYSPSNEGYATWFDLPIYNYLTSGDYFNYSYTTYNLTIWYTNTSAPASAWLYFKIVIITNP